MLKFKRVLPSSKALFLFGDKNEVTEYDTTVTFLSSDMNENNVVINRVQNFKTFYVRFMSASLQSTVVRTISKHFSSFI